MLENRCVRISGVESSLLTPKPVAAGPCILLDLLPPELLQIIIAEHVEDRADIQALSRTCHALQSLTSSPALGAAWLWRWHGNQALFRQSSLSSLPVLRQLIEVHHADINAERAGDNLAFSLLHIACRYDRTELMDFLFSAPSINVNKTCADEGMKMTPLHMACIAGSVRAVRQLLALPQVLVSTTTPQGFSCLHLACIKQRVEVVEELLRHPDVDVNLMSVGNARSPLAVAADMGDSAIVALLLQHPAINVNAAGALGSSLHLAIDKRHMVVLRLLLQHPGILVNAPDQFGRTGLDIACEQSSLDLVAELLQHADINVNLETAEHGFGALRRAALRGNTPVVALLLKHPAIDVNAAGVQGLRPLNMASFNGHAHVVRELQRHPNILVNADDGLTNLDVACTHGHLAVINELLMHPGLDADSIRTALTGAVERGQTAVVELLRGSRAARRALRGQGGA